MGRLTVAACCVGVACIAACGRLDFKAAPDGAVDAPIDAPLPTLSCTGVSSFPLGVVSDLAATGTTDGFVAITVDGSGNLHGVNFKFENDLLVENVAPAALDTNATGILGAVTTGNTVVVAAAIGRPTASSSRTYALDSSTLALGGSAVSRGSELAVLTPLAASGADSGIAYASIDNGGSAVNGRLLASTGADTSPPSAIVAASLSPNTISLASAGTGYAVAWDYQLTGLSTIGVALLDAQLQVVAGPAVADDKKYDAYSGRLTWAPTSNVYLATWHEKDAADNDNVWISILNASLQVVVPAMEIATNSTDAVAASDGTGFLMVWSASQPSTHLAAAYVSATGTVTTRMVPLTAAGYSPSKWTMVSHASQPVLIWTATNTMVPGSMLSFSPVCN